MRARALAVCCLLAAVAGCSPGVTASTTSSSAVPSSSPPASSSPAAPSQSVASAPAASLVPTLQATPTSQNPGGISDADLTVLGHINDDYKEWNAILTPVVTDYRDPGVDGRTFVAEAQKTFPRLSAIATELVALPLAIQAHPLAQGFTSINRMYPIELIDLQSLVRAVVSGNAAAQRQAASLVSADGQQKGEAATTFVQQVRAQYGDELAALLSGTSG